MYISKSLLEGLRILGFDKETIKQVSKEKHLEEIFLATLFLNYLIIMVMYLLGFFIGSYRLDGRLLNMELVYAFLMIYPFIFNVLVYGIYGFFGLFAEMLNRKNHVKPLISVGFHTGIVYTIVLYIFSLFAFFDLGLALFLFAIYFVYFIYIMFLSISTIYNFSFGQTLIVLFIPLMIIAMILFIIGIIFPDLLNLFFSTLFIN